MNNLNDRTQLVIAALIGLIIMHMVMLGALFSGVEPKPPAFFGPFIGATIAAAAATIFLLLTQHKYQVHAVLLVLLMALPGVGPQKIFIEPDILILSPIVLLGTGCLGILLTYLVKARTTVEPGYEQTLAGANE